MADLIEGRRALGDRAARQLANTTKTVAQLGAITPRWLVRFLSWLPVEAGTLRINRVREDTTVEVTCGARDERELPETFVDYEEQPRERSLSQISSVIDVHTRISDLYSAPHDQIREQLRLAVEIVKERQESELINNEDYGLLNNAAASMRLSTRNGRPTPDDFDELIARVWKEPAFFLAHPRAIAAFGRECTRRGVPPPTVSIFGSQFLTWRGLPLVPTDKLRIQNGEAGTAGKTNILLMRTGEARQGVVGLFQPNLPGEQTPGLSVRSMGISRNAIASYLISLYCSAAVLTDDALGVLENVSVDQYCSTNDSRVPGLGELDLGSLVDARTVVDAGQALADAIAGVPGVDALTRLANEFLRESFSATAPMTGAAEQALQGLPYVGAFVPAVGGASLPALTTPLRFDAGRAADAVASSASFYFIDEQRVPRAGASPVRAGQTTDVASLLVPSGYDLFDPAAIRRDFPILAEVINGHPLVWLDNAATTQKPQAVIDRMAYFYAHENSNVHRAAHALAARSTDAYEAAREQTRRFLNAGSTAEIVFVRGATEGINLVAQSWGRRHIRAGDEIILTWLEHHSNIVPWQLLAADTGARIRVVPIDDRGQVRLDEYQKLLGPRTRLVSLAHVSNALGTVTPVQEMVQLAHRYGARVLVDGAQAVSHMPVDVQVLDADFYVFSGHKVFGPTGIGVVRGKPEAWEETPPWQGGGNMIVDVTFEKTVYHRPPGRFEAGTGSIGDAVGLGAALAYLERIGMANVARHEQDLLAYGTGQLTRIPGLRLIGTAHEKAGVLSFVLDGFRSEEVGSALDREGIAVRSGHHCAQPALRRYGLETTVRPSLAVYNSRADLDALTDALLTLTQERQSRRW